MIILNIIKMLKKKFYRLLTPNIYTLEDINITPLEIIKILYNESMFYV